MMFAVLRVIVAVGGGWIAVTRFGGSEALFAVLAFALVFYGLGNVASVGGRAWFGEARTEPRAAPLEEAAASRAMS
jgi:hypothetical protein